MATLFKRSNGIYYHIVRVHGRYIWKSTGARSKSEARKVVAGNFRKPAATPPELTLSEYTSQFLHYAQTNFATATVSLYKQAASAFNRVVGDFNLKAYTVWDVEAFKSKRLQEVSPVKVNIDFRTLRAFFQTALRWKLISENPFHGV